MRRDRAPKGRTAANKRHKQSKPRVKPGSAQWPIATTRGTSRRVAPNQGTYRRKEASYNKANPRQTGIPPNGQSPQCGGTSRPESPQTKGRTAAKKRHTTKQTPRQTESPDPMANRHNAGYVPPESPPRARPTSPAPPKKPTSLQILRRSQVHLPARPTTLRPVHASSDYRSR